MKIKRHVEEICMNCEFYSIIVRVKASELGGPYCAMKREFIDSDQPGRHSCVFWTEKKPVDLETVD